MFQVSHTSWILENDKGTQFYYCLPFKFRVGQIREFNLVRVHFWRQVKFVNLRCIAHPL